MKVTDPIMKKFTYNQLKALARTRFNQIVPAGVSNGNKDELLFALAGFYGLLVQDIKNFYGTKNNN